MDPKVFLRSISTPRKLTNNLWLTYGSKDKNDILWCFFLVLLPSLVLVPRALAQSSNPF